MKKNSNYLILIILLIIIFLFIYNANIFNIKNIKRENFNNGTVITQNYKYYRCNNKMLGTILKDIFDTNNITQSNDDWNIYIPCGYNNIEEELNQISINNKNKNKYIFGVNGCDTIVSKNKI